jgi:hypothetical protein
LQDDDMTKVVLVIVMSKQRLNEVVEVIAVFGLIVAVGLSL